jgi:RecA/RadA recombinase
MPLKALALPDMADDDIWIGSDFLDANRITGNSLFKFVPSGNIVTIAGQEASGKSLLGSNLLKNGKDVGYFPVMVETEKALSYQSARTSGLLNNPHLGGLLLRTGYVESCLVSVDHVINRCVKSGVKPAILLDSLGNLDIEKTVADVAKGKLVLDQGQFQRSVKIMLKHLTNLCAIHDIPFIIITHIFYEPGMFGGKRIYGGQHLKFLSNTILFTSTIKRKDGKGYDLKLTSLKNRVCPPFQEARIEIDMKTSEVKRFAGLAQVALDLELFEKAGSHIYVPHLDKKLYRSQIEGNRSNDVFIPEFLEQLEDKILTSGYDTITFSDELANELFADIEGADNTSDKKKKAAETKDTKTKDADLLEERASSLSNKNNDKDSARMQVDVDAFLPKEEKVTEEAPE